MGTEHISSLDPFDLAFGQLEGLPESLRTGQATVLATTLLEATPTPARVIVGAIQQIGADGSMPASVVRACIADLPAEVL